MTFQETSQILANDQVSDGYRRIRLTCGPHYKEAVPGQFVTFRLPGQSEPLLRRPFSIHRLVTAEKNNVQMEILYRMVGGFTKQLSRLRPGGLIDMVGPLGRGFSVNCYSEPVAVAAGGIGVAPLVFLADRLKQAGTDMELVTVFLGGRTNTDILCKDIFSDLGARISVVTEDGTAGEHGLVTDPLETWLEKNKPTMIYACGPHGMLNAVGKIAQSGNIACEISVETLMACGVGVCMGCAVYTNEAGEGYRHVCKDGPVFDARILF
ncbi:MAG: dihydroorotate dehydrogenase electron transfer subunit [Desulfobacteraceae bacterium]|nr:dihydroorotate dehydrogenase electron transfer subunit [Desulfobacteraceae bacterium]